MAITRLYVSVSWVRPFVISDMMSTVVTSVTVAWLGWLSGG